MAKRNRKDTSFPSLVSLPPDLLDCIFRELGLHGINLRATCQQLATTKLAPGVELALKVLQAGPSIPLKNHAQRRTTRACALVEWNYFSYRSTLVWRLEWALALKTIDHAPIHALLDAFDLVPSGRHNFFGSIWIGGHHLESKTPRYLSYEVRECESYPECLYCSEDFRIRGTNYTSHVKVALFKAIEARMWDLIWGEDLDRPMSAEEVVSVVRRILDTTPVRNDRCFHFTNKGWLKYTPFLLAAERHNLPLVEYLSERGDTDTTACSAGGNNAYAICRHALERRRASAQAIAESKVLQHLAQKCWCHFRPYKAEGRV